MHAKSNDISSIIDYKISSEKKILKTFYCLLIMVLLFVSCKAHENNEIIVKGHLTGIDVKEISLNSDDLSFKSSVDSNGTFIFKFVSNQPRVYQLKFDGKLNLFLIPGDSVIINKDGEDYKFSGGQSAVLSNYYWEWEKYSNLPSYHDEKKYYSREPDDFFKAVYAYIDTFHIPLNELLKKVTNINPEFMRLENERIKYWMIIDFLPYEYEKYKYYTGKEPAINKSFHDYMKDVNLNDSSLLQLEAYKDFLHSYIREIPGGIFKNNTEISKDKYTETNFILNFLFNEFKNQRILDYLIYQVMDQRLYNLQVDDKILTTIKEHCKNKDYSKYIENKYKGSLLLLPGKPAPDFTLYDTNNKEYKLSDFKGKYLLIDVWGVFCGPCKKEIPYLKQIEQDYKGKNIEFICTCFEDKTEIWLKKIKEFDLKGIQLIAKGSWHSQFGKDYQIDWVPTYILIDKEGKIIDARASRPSENLRELLNQTCNIEKMTIPSIR